MKIRDAINSLAWMVINAKSNGYVSQNDVDFANECLDKLQAAEPRLQGDELQACPDCRCIEGHLPGCSQYAIPNPAIRP